MTKTLLASIALALSSVAAGAADLQVKAPMSYVTESWSGFYVGASAGVARHQATWNELSTTGDCITDGCSGTFILNKTGAIVGGLAGYNFQHRSFVFGVEVDGSWLDTDASQEWRPGRNHSAFQQGKIDGLVTLRGRAGLAVDATLLYLTVGLALANVRDSISMTAPTATIATNCSTTTAAANDDCSQWRAGWIAGGGVEHMFDPHWTGRLEVLYMDFGNETASGSWRGTQSESFSDSVVLARGAVAYKF